MRYNIIKTILLFLLSSFPNSFAFAKEEQSSVDIVRNINQNINKSENADAAQDLLRKVHNNTDSSEVAKEKNQKLVDQIHQNQSHNKVNLPPVLAEAMKGEQSNLITAQKDKLAGSSGILIFVSSSMPKIAVQNYLYEAKKYNATLLMRGFINDSIPSTYNYVKELSNSGVGIGIDPNSFDKFGITQVPTIIVFDPSSDCASKDCLPNHDRVSGNVTLKYALERISTQGEFGKSQAILSLNKVKREEE